MTAHVFVLDEETQNARLQKEIGTAPEGFLSSDDGRGVVATMTIMDVYNIATTHGVYIEGSQVTMCPYTHVLVVETKSSALIDSLQQELTLRDEFPCNERIIPFAQHSKRANTKKVSI